MGQILHGSATTTHAIRAAIQRSQATVKELAAQYGLDPKTVAKWRKRAFVHDAPMGPKQARSSVLTQDEEAIAVAFRKHTLLPLDDCLYALQATIPHLTRSSLHRCYQRHGIGRLPEIEGEKPPKKKFKVYDSHDQLRQYLAAFLAAYNYAKRLKSIRGLTPHEYICKIWTEKPDQFRLNPIHHTPGPNS